MSEFLRTSDEYRTLLYYCSTCHIQPVFRNQKRKPYVSTAKKGGQHRMFNTVKPTLHNQWCKRCEAKRTLLLAKVFDGVIGELQCEQLEAAALFFSTIKPVLRVHADPVISDDSSHIHDAW